jgi:hypothetical protein
MRRFTLICVAGLIAAACASFSSSNDETTTPANDGGVSPEGGADGAIAPPPGPIGDASTDTTIVYEDFEATGCNGWNDKGASVVTSNAAANSPSTSCLICGKGGFAAKKYAFTAAGKYKLYVFVRNSDAGLADTIQLTLKAENAQMDQLDNRNVTFGLGATFVMKETPAIDVDAAVSDFEVSVDPLGNRGCLFIDDLRIVAQ